MRSRRLGVLLSGFVVVAAAACRNDFTLPGTSGLLLIDSWPSAGVGDGGPGIAAGLSNPLGIAVLGTNWIYVADTGESRIRRMSISSGTIETIAGNGFLSNVSAPGRPANEASIGNPISVTVTPDGHVFWLDAGTCSIYTVGTAGDVVRAAGRGNCTGADSTALPPLQQGLAVNGCAQIHSDTLGNLVIADPNNGRVRYWNRTSAPAAVAGQSAPAGIVTTIVGGGGGPTAATGFGLNNPCDAVLRTSDGSLFVTNTNSGQILLVDGGGNVSAMISGLAGPSNVLPATSGPDLVFFTNGDQRVYAFNRTGGTAPFGATSILSLSFAPIAGTQNVNGTLLTATDGTALSQTFSFANGNQAPLAFLNGDLLVADPGNAALRLVHASDNAMTILAGLSPMGTVGRALFQPVSLTLASNGALLVAAANARLFEVGPGTVTAVAGDGDPVVGASDSGFWATAIAAVPGTRYIADAHNHRIRVIQQGVVRTIGGNGNNGSGGDGGLLSAATFSGPSGVLPYGTGILLADNERIRFANLGADPVTVAGITVDGGHVDSIAGANGNGFSGDGGPARQAQVSMGSNRTIGMLVRDGVLYFSDHDNNRIRRVDLATGIIDTALGSGTGGTHGVGHPTGLALQEPWLYWSQLDGNLVRRYSFNTGAIETLAGDGVASYYGDGGPAFDAELSAPQGLVIDAAGTIYVADSTHRVRRFYRSP